jgi:hypothetical protein
LRTAEGPWGGLYRRAAAAQNVVKALVVQHRQQNHVRDEKAVMDMVEHSGVVQLFTTFNDRDRVYFLTEFCRGGDLFGYIRAKCVCRAARCLAGADELSAAVQRADGGGARALRGS